jgi:signal transduction histidine kinase
VSEELGRLFEENADPLLLVAADRRVLAMNAAARALFGAAPPGTTCQELLRCQDHLGRSRGETARCFGAVCAHRRQNLHNVNMTVVSGRGSSLPVSASYTYLEEEVPGGGFLIALRDLSAYLRWHDSHLRRAQEEARSAERQRLAMDVHDNLGQLLVTLSILVRLLGESVAQGQLPRARTHLEMLERVAAEASAEVRRTLQAAAPSHATSLAAVVEELLQSLPRLTDMKLSFENAAGEVVLRAEASHDVAQILREAVTNALRHAQASHIAVRLEPARGGVLLTVADNGRGLSQAPLAEGHLGLVSMRERASRLGAELSLWSQPGQGVRMELLLPTAVLAAEAAPETASSGRSAVRPDPRTRSQEGQGSGARRQHA